MPTSVIIAIAAVSIVFLERVILGLVAVAAGTASLLVVLLSGGLSAIILIGIIKGHRLAWQWGRILGLIGAILLTIITVATLGGSIAEKRAGMAFAAVILGSQAILLFVLFFMLGTTDSKKHFQLVCPACNLVTTKAANFFFTKAKCKACNNEW
jgi:hypothetical protein